MIPVRAVDDVFVLQRRIAAFELRHDVLRVDRPQRVLDRDRRLHAERHRLELAGRGLLLQRIEVLARQAQDLLRRVERDPAFDVGARPCSCRASTRSNFSRRLPCTTENGIAGRPGLVDDEDRRRALARALFELVRPAAVVRHRIAPERLRVELRRIGGIGHRRIVHEDEDRLAFDVHVLEIIPVELRRFDAIAGEHDVGVLDRRAVGDVFGPRHDFVRPFECLLVCPLRDRQRLGFGAGDADERNLLDKRAVGIAGLQIQLLELILDVLDASALRPSCRVRGPRIRLRKAP